MKVPYNKSPVQSDLVAAWYKHYFETKAHECLHIGGFKEKHDFAGMTDIYITSFGNNFFIDYQIKTIRKFWKNHENCEIIVVDNNHQENAHISEELYDFCLHNAHYGVAYIKPPHNHYQEKQHFDPSMKLGTTLSWLFHNVVKVRKPEMFFFLDQDCFIFREFNAKTALYAGMYGTVCENKPKWNIHVTQCGFKYDFVKDLPLDFRPSWKHGLDTGGANYDILYANKNIEDYRLIHKGVRFFKEDTVSGIRPQHYEIIDECWIHLCASTHDALEGEGQRKLDYLKGFLDRALMFD
jgi:hypothetical protein